MSDQYPSDCTAVAFASADPSVHNSSNTPSRVDCQREGSTLKLVFSPPFTVDDPANPPYRMDGGAYSKDPNVPPTLQSNTAFSTKNGLYSRTMYSVKYNTTDTSHKVEWYLDYFFKNDISGLGAAFKNKTELEATAYVPANVSAAQLSVVDEMMQTLTCKGTGCTK